jgi:hypothetical protein
MDTTLKGIALIEKDDNDEVLLTWSYPAFEYPELETVAKTRTNLLSVPSSAASGAPGRSVIIPFSFSKYKNIWIYIFTSPVTAESKLKRTVAFSMCLFTESYFPEKYGALSKLMSGIYHTTSDPVKVLECYLDVFTSGKYSKDSMTFDSSSFDVKECYLATSIKDIIQMFEDDAILIWSAMLMKKRVAVYCEKLGPLLKFIRGLPLFVWYRQDWNILRPWTGLSDIEVKDLMTTGVYVAGFTDPSIKRNSHLYDVLIDVTNRTIDVSDNVKDEFVLSPFHQELSAMMTKYAKDANVSDQNIIKELTIKTKQLLTKLDSLKVQSPEGYSFISLQDLQQKQFPPGMDRFLFSVASAEGLTKTTTHNN